MVKNYIFEIWFRGNAVRTFAEIEAAFARSRWHDGTAVGKVSLYVELRDAIVALLRDDLIAWTEDGRLTAIWSGA